jgi:predicted kinase
MRTLILTVGLPRSGKSTWAKETGHPVVNPDSIRLALHGQAYIKSAEGFVWAIAKTMVASLFLAGHDTVVLDATNTTIKRQEDWNEVAGEAGAVVRFKVFYTEPEVCIRRAVEADTDEVLIPVINRMSIAWEHPPKEQCI